MKPDETEDQLARAGAELDAMMQLFASEHGGTDGMSSSDNADRDDYEVRKRRDVAELVARIEELRRRRNRRRLVVAACGMAACLALALLLPFGNRIDEPAPVEQTYDVPVLIVDNRAPVALTPGGDLPATRPDNDAAQPLREEPETVADKQQEPQPVRPSVHRILVPAGQTYSLQLADGSRVMMNAGSSISYRVPFDRSLRELTLQGEAFFEIAHAETPFEVVVGEVRVRVYGTRFNIRQTTGGHISTVLVEGSVGMHLPDGRELRMEPDERISFDRTTGIVTVQHVDANEYVAWLDGRFKYTDAPLAEVLDDLTKWYGVRLGCPDAGDARLTLDMSRQTDLKSMLSDLELLVGKKIQIEKQLPMK